MSLHDAPPITFFFYLFAFDPRLESKFLTLCSSALRLALSPRPARLMKQHTHPRWKAFRRNFLDASVRAMVAAVFVNSPGGAGSSRW